MRRVVAAGLSAATTRVALTALRRMPPGGPARWTRTNHAGRAVTLLEGPALVAGASAVMWVSPVGAASAAAAGAFGVLDDLTGTTDSKGLKGHLGALARGEVTTGAIKIVGLGATGVVAAIVVDRGRLSASTLAAAGVVAGAANVLNLFDLRPGRALKVALLAGIPVAATGSATSAALVGTALAGLPEDLSGTAMMGDTGANALGALAGVALIEQLGGRSRWLTFGTLVALTLASERVSFSKVIAGNTVLRTVDEWGRRPA